MRAHRSALGGLRRPTARRRSGGETAPGDFPSIPRRHLGRGVGAQARPAQRVGGDAASRRPRAGRLCHGYQSGGSCGWCSPGPWPANRPTGERLWSYVVVATPFGVNDVVTRLGRLSAHSTSRPKTKACRRFSARGIGRAERRDITERASSVRPRYPLFDPDRAAYDEPAFPGTATRGGLMRPGQEIEVRSRFEGSWVRGFEVVQIETDEPAPSVLVRRRSDGEVLPVRFPLSAVREKTLEVAEPG